LEKLCGLPRWLDDNSGKTSLTISIYFLSPSLVPGENNNAEHSLSWRASCNYYDVEIPYFTIYTPIYDKPNCATVISDVLDWSSQNKTFSPGLKPSSK